MKNETKFNKRPCAENELETNYETEIFFKSGAKI